MGLAGVLMESNMSPQKQDTESKCKAFIYTGRPMVWTCQQEFSSAVKQSN